MARRQTSRRVYMVDGRAMRSFSAATGRAVALAVERGECVCVETRVGRRTVERIDVKAALSIDPIKE